MTSQEQIESIENLSNQSTEEDLKELWQILKYYNTDLSRYATHRTFVETELKFLSDIKGKPYQPIYSVGDCLELLPRDVKVTEYNGKYTCKYGVLHENFGCPYIETWGSGQKMLKAELNNFYAYPFVDSSKISYKITDENISETEIVCYYLLGYKL